MTKLEEILQKDLITAAKEKDTLKLSTLRLVKTEIQKERTKSGFKANEFNDSAVEAILQKMCKERTETAEIYASNGREDLANKELAEKKIIIEYLPKQATIEEVKECVSAVIAETGASSMKDIGTVMKSVNAKLGSRSDGKTISAIVKEFLTK